MSIMSTMVMVSDGERGFGSSDEECLVAGRRSCEEGERPRAGARAIYIVMHYGFMGEGERDDYSVWSSIAGRPPISRRTDLTPSVCIV